MVGLQWNYAALSTYLADVFLAINHDTLNDPNMLMLIKCGRRVTVKDDSFHLSPFAQQYRLPFSSNDLPLQEKQLTPFLFKTIFSRRYQGTRAHVFMPFSSVLLLHPDHANNHANKTSNIFPDAPLSPDYGINPGNWMSISPWVEDFSSVIKRWKQILAPRKEPRLILPYSDIGTDNTNYRAQFAPIVDKHDIVTVNVEDGTLKPVPWKTIKQYGKQPKFELVVENRGDVDRQTANVFLPREAQIDPNKNYIFVDVRNNEPFEYSGSNLFNRSYNRHELPVQLNSRWNSERPHTHHFIVFELE